MKQEFSILLNPEKWRCLQNFNFSHSVHWESAENKLYPGFSICYTKVKCSASAATLYPAAGRAHSQGSDLVYGGTERLGLRWCWLCELCHWEQEGPVIRYWRLETPLFLCLSALWCSLSLAAGSKGGFLTIFRLSTWKDRLEPWASLGCSLTFCIFRSCPPLPQAMPSADGSNDLFLSKSTSCGMRGHWKLPSEGNPPHPPKCRLKMRKRAWRHFI